MCSDGKGCHGNGVVSWRRMSADTYTAAPQTSLHPSTHTYSELQVSPQELSFLILIGTLEGQQITISGGANFPQCPAATGTHCARGHRHQY